MTEPARLAVHRCEGCGTRLTEFYDTEYRLCEACWTRRKNEHNAGYQ